MTWKIPALPDVAVDDIRPGDLIRLGPDKTLGRLSLDRLTARHPGLGTIQNKALKWVGWNDLFLVIAVVQIDEPRHRPGSQGPSAGVLDLFVVGGEGIGWFALKPGVPMFEVVARPPVVVVRASVGRSMVW